MDMSSGRLYPSRQAALDAGVPEHLVAEVVKVANEIPGVGGVCDLYRPTSGPMRGRIYERTRTGLLRRKDLERSERARRRG